MIMGNLLRDKDVPPTVMATNSGRGTDPDPDAEEGPVPGIAHPTVVPSNYDDEDTVGNEGS
jgi:hypothetical protein